MKANLPKLLLLGAMLAINWIFLFEDYNHTSVAAATMCYYMAPVFVILLSPVIFGEKITLRKGVCSAVAIFGMVLVSDVLSSGLHGAKGLLFGLIASNGLRMYVTNKVDFGLNRNLMIASVTIILGVGMECGGIAIPLGNYTLPGMATATISPSRIMPTMNPMISPLLIPLQMISRFFMCFRSLPYLFTFLLTFPFRGRGTAAAGGGG